MEDVVIKILPDFTIWKLHSFKEILLFFLVLATGPVSYTHLRAHETRGNLVCRLLLEKKK